MTSSPSRGAILVGHPVRGRFNAWVLAALDRYMHAMYAERKAALLANLPPVLLELGPGVGANVRYYPPGTHLIAIEPNPHMHARLRHRAAGAGVTLELKACSAEALDLPSDSVDFVFASLVLCSVADPDAVVAEVYRVLRPGGRFACLEHVRAPAHSRVLSLQRLLARPWAWVFEGCNLCRDTESLLRAAPFRHVALQPFAAPTFVLPLRYQIVATCVK